MHKCAECAFEAGGPGALQIHVEAEHRGLRPFRCSRCTYACAAAGTLQMHMRRKHDGACADDLPAAKRVKRAPVASTAAADGDALLLDPRKPALIVGEADFSFALALTTAHGRSLPALCATTHATEAHALSGKLWKRLRQNVRVLRKRGVTVLFSVDATALSSATVGDAPLERVIFCFPRATTVCGVHAANAALLGGFFAKAKALLAPRSGRIVILLHVCLLDGVPNDQWDEWNVGAIAKEHGLVRDATLALDRAALQQYQPRAVDGRSFAPDAALFHFLKVA